MYLLIQMFFSSVLFLSFCVLPIFSVCNDGGQIHHEGDKWIRNRNFLVTCVRDQIKVLKCITDAGTHVDKGTKSVVENGVEYSCEDLDSVEGSGEEERITVNGCGTFADANDDMIVGNLVICCISRRFKACIDDNGDTVKNGFFVVNKSLLKYCNIQNQGWNARVEPRGCFNGTRNDDTEDTDFHVKKYATWQQGDYEYRCGDDGIRVHRCLVNGKWMYTGNAWIDKEGVVHRCK